MVSELTFRLLGGAEIEHEGKPLPLTAVKTRALLFYLALTKRVHSRDALAGLLWAEMTDAAAKTNLRQALTALRKLLPDHLLITRHDVGLNLEAPIHIDVEDFETAVRHSDLQHLTELKTAAALYSGELLAGFFVENGDAFITWLQTQRERLHSLAVQALDTLANHYTRRRDVGQGLHYTGELLALEPWREESHQQMMRLLAWNGHFAAALAQYQTCRHLLDEALGVEPLPETTLLYERIQDARTATRVAVPLASDPFVDREELSEVTSWLHNPDCRLLTVVGVGGAGKTRLVMQAAVQQAALYLDGVYFVELTGLEDEAQVVTAVANTVGLSFSGSKSGPEQLQDFLRYKEVLLVLDNFEHLLTGDATAVTLLLDLLAEAEALKLLLSSRERLNVAEEWVFELQGLPYPPNAHTPDLASYSAVQLFQQTAQRLKRDFDFSKHYTAVVTICHLVKGLPLGIKLAASLTISQTVEQIAQNLNHNVDVLTTRLRNMPERHRSLRATFDYSWQLLAPAEQILLANLSLFRGSFSREAAQSITRASLDGLMTLVDKSLLNFVEDGRYELHALLREFAAEKFAHVDSQVIKQRYTHYFLNWLGELGTEIEEKESKTAVAKIHAELDNIRQAWQWSVTYKQYDILAAALPPLTTFYTLAASAQEGMLLIQQAVSALEGEPEPPLSLLLGQLLTSLAALKLQQGLNEEALADVRQAIPLLPPEAVQLRAAAILQLGRGLRIQGDTEAAITQLTHASRLATSDRWLRGEAVAHQQLGIVHRTMGQLDKAEEHARRALAVARVIGNSHQESLSLAVLAVTVFDQSDYPRAEAYCEEALHIMRAMGNRRGESSILNTVALIRGWTGRFAEAQQIAQESLQIDRQLGDQQRIGDKLNNLGLQAMHLGELITAKRYYEESLAIDRTFGNRLNVGIILGNLGDVAMCLGDFAQAQVNYEQAMAIRCDIGDRRGEAWILCSLSLLGGKREQYDEGLAYGQQALAVIAETGERSKEGFAWTHIGHAYAGLGEYEAAREAYETAVAIRAELGQAHMLGVNWSGLAEVALQAGDTARAFSFVEQLLDAIAQGKSGGTRESGRAEWSCFQILQAVGDERANEVLETAVNRIQTVARGIRSRTQQHDYLNKVLTHRRLLAVWEAMHS